MLLSVIIPAFNEEKYLKHTIERIEQALQEHAGAAISWEFIVCDNNSSDKTSEIASQMGAKVAFEPINQISRARNTGAAPAEGDWLLFIDADSYPPPELIRETLALIHSGEFIGCGATVRAEGGTLWNRLRIERLNPFMKWFGWCGGLYILCEKTAFQAIKGFSPALYAYEEIDFVIRLRRLARKKKLKFTVLHQHPVVTSGRKGNYSAGQWVTLVISNVLALLFFMLHYFFPEKWVPKSLPKALGYWYNGQR